MTFTPHTYEPLSLGWCVQRGWFPNTSTTISYNTTYTSTSATPTMQWLYPTYARDYVTPATWDIPQRVVRQAIQGDERAFIREVERQMFPERPAPPPSMTDGAERRSRDLLMSCLTDEQRSTLQRSDYFRCVSDQGEIFEITKRRVHGVFKLDARGIRVEEWCVTPFGEFPLYDVMLAQKLALETDSRALARRANIRDLATGRYVFQSESQFILGRQPDYLLQA